MQVFRSVSHTLVKYWLWQEHTFDTDSSRGKCPGFSYKMLPLQSFTGDLNSLSGNWFFLPVTPKSWKTWMECLGEGDQPSQHLLTCSVHCPKVQRSGFSARHLGLMVNTYNYVLTVWGDKITSILGDSDDGPPSPTWHCHWCYLLLAKAAAVAKQVPVLALGVVSHLQTGFLKNATAEVHKGSITPVLQRRLFLICSGEPAFLPKKTTG